MTIRTKTPNLLDNPPVPVAEADKVPARFHRNHYPVKVGRSTAAPFGDVDGDNDLDVLITTPREIPVMSGLGH